MQYTNMQTFAQLTKFTVPEAFALKNTLKPRWLQVPLCFLVISLVSTAFMLQWKGFPLASCRMTSL